MVEQDPELVSEALVLIRNPESGAQVLARPAKDRYEGEDEDAGHRKRF